MPNSACHSGTSPLQRPQSSLECDQSWGVWCCWQGSHTAAAHCIAACTADNQRGDGNWCSQEQSPVLHTSAWCNTALVQGSNLIAQHWWWSHPSTTSRWVAMKEFTCTMLGPLCCYQRRAFLFPFIFHVGRRKQALASSPARLRPQGFTHLCLCVGWRGPLVAPACVCPNCASPPSWSFAEALARHSRGLWGLWAVLQ